MCDICVFFVLKSTTLQFYYPIKHVLLFFTLTLFIIDSRIRILLITLCIIIFFMKYPLTLILTQPLPLVKEGDFSLSLTRILCDYFILLFQLLLLCDLNLN